MHLYTVQLLCIQRAASYVCSLDVWRQDCRHNLLFIVYVAHMLINQWLLIILRLAREKFHPTSILSDLISWYMTFVYCTSPAYEYATNAQYDFGWRLVINANLFSWYVIPMPIKKADHLSQLQILTYMQYCPFLILNSQNCRILRNPKLIILGGGQPEN